MSANRDSDFDAAIIGGGPAGLSAALILGRACRRVILFDHGHPRNYVAQAVHGFLGLDGITPNDLRDRGRKEVRSYGVEINDCEVNSATCLSTGEKLPTLFQVTASERSIRSRALLLATGVVDYLPDIPGIRELYGHSVHHCPYCDGWEHRDKHLVALAEPGAIVKLAQTLRGWSDQVTACSNGSGLSTSDHRALSAQGIKGRDERVESIVGNKDTPIEVRFAEGPPLACEALFFSPGQGQRSALPQMLGCSFDEDGLIQTSDKQAAGVKGLFVGGDAHTDVQFAIVAAAEGAIAAAAINRMLQAQDTSS